MDYGTMVEKALRGVVRDALLEAAEHGFEGNHHFYISFATDCPGVVVPDHLRQRFDGVMTIVLQHQFWGLEVSEDGFEVTLSFNKVHERLQIPLAAVTDFHDPSVPFGLRFGPEDEQGVRPFEGVGKTARVLKRAGQEDEQGGGSFEGARKTVPVEKRRAAAADDAADADEAKTGEVITLDSFRNKK